MKIRRIDYRTSLNLKSKAILIIVVIVVMVVIVNVVITVVVVIVGPPVTGHNGDHHEHRRSHSFVSARLIFGGRTLGQTSISRLRSD